MHILPTHSELHVVGDAFLWCMPSPHATNTLDVTVAGGLRTVSFVTLSVVIDVFVQIVHAAKQYGSCLVSIAQSEATGLVAPLSSLGGTWGGSRF